MEKRNVDAHSLGLRFDKSFSAKMSQADEAAKSFYAVLKNRALSYKKANARLSWNYESINVHRTKLLRLAVKGKTLCLYLALDPEKLDHKYKVEKAKAAKFAETPCLYRIVNSRRCAYGKELIDVLMQKFGIDMGKEKNQKYDFPYKSTEQLLKEGLIKDRG